MQFLIDLLAKFISKDKKPGWVASGFVENLACMAHVTSHGDGKPVIHRLVMNEITEKKCITLKAIIKKYKMAHYRHIFLLGYREYSLIQVEKPHLPEDEIKEAIRWTVKDQLGYPAEQAEIQVLDIPLDVETKNAVAQSFVAASKAETIKFYTEKFEGFAKGALEVIDLPELAQRNIARLLEQKERGLALLTMNSKGGLLTFTANGELYQARYFATDTKALVAEGTESQQQIYELLTLELQRLLDNFELKFPHIFVNRIVLAPFAGRDGFADYLDHSLNIRVETFSITTLFDLDKNIQLGDFAQEGNALLFLGATLREELAT